MIDDELAGRDPVICRGGPGGHARQDGQQNRAGSRYPLSVFHETHERTLDDVMTQNLKLPPIRAMAGGVIALTTPKVGPVT